MTTFLLSSYSESSIMRHLRHKVMMKTDVRNPLKVSVSVSVWQLTEIKHLKLMRKGAI